MVHLLNLVTQSVTKPQLLSETATQTNAKPRLNNPFHMLTIQLVSIFGFGFYIRMSKEATCHHFIRSDQHFNRHTHLWNTLQVQVFTVFTRKLAICTQTFSLVSITSEGSKLTCAYFLKTYPHANLKLALTWTQTWTEVTEVNWN